MTVELSAPADPPVVGKLSNLLGRHGADALVAIDRAARASGFALGRRVVPELPRRLRIDRCDEEAERGDSDGIEEVPRGSTQAYDDEQEADE
jgi:hypothetical protein